MIRLSVMLMVRLILMVIMLIRMVDCVLVSSSDMMFWLKELVLS